MLRFKYAAMTLVLVMLLVQPQAAFAQEGSPVHIVDGVVFADINNDQIMDGEEAGIPAVILEFSNGSDPGITVETDAAGRFALELVAGTWRITVYPPDGYGDPDPGLPEFLLPEEPGVLSLAIPLSILQEDAEIGDETLLEDETGSPAEENELNEEEYLTDEDGPNTRTTEGDEELSENVNLEDMILPVSGGNFPSRWAGLLSIIFLLSLCIVGIIAIRRRAKSRFFAPAVLVLGLLAMLILVTGTILPLIPAEVIDMFLANIPFLDNFAYKPMEPDEFVYDNTLSVEVPRLYILKIPGINLEAPVVRVDENTIEVENRRVSQVYVPHSYAVGWNSSSAAIGQSGNTVLVGHNNMFGEVFKDLRNLQAGDEIIVQTGSGDRVYRVSQVVTLEEDTQSIENRIENASWIQPTSHEQLTLVTCFPYWSNTHRLIVIAHPG